MIGKKLTQRQRSFAENLVILGMSATQAAKDAGYSEKTARVIAQDTLLIPAVAAHIEKLREEVTKSKIKTRNEILASLSEAFDDPEAKYSEKAAVAKVIGRWLGFESPKQVEMTVSVAAQKLESHLDRAMGIEQNLESP